MSAELKIQIKIPEVVQANENHSKVYEAVFKHVFEFIQSTGKLCPENIEEVSQAANNHAQAIFMAKMGMKDAADYKDTAKALNKALGLTSVEDQGTVQELLGKFTEAADKIEAYTKLVENNSASMLGIFKEIENKEAFIPYLQQIPQVLGGIETSPEANLRLDDRIERNTKISIALFKAIETTRAQDQKLIETNGDYHPQKEDLINNLRVALNHPDIGIQGLTDTEKLSLIKTIEEDFKTVEHAEAQSNKLVDFITNNKQWLIMFVPFIIGPLVKAFSVIPVLGKPLAGLASMLSSEKVLTPMLVALAARTSRGNTANAQDSPTTAKEPAPAKAVESSAKTSVAP